MILPLFLVVVMSISSAFSQTQQQTKVLKPKMPISEIAFVATLLETVEIRGNEVDAFVDVKNVLMKIIDKATTEKKKAADETVLEINIAQAQNLLALLQRARLTGGDADRYKKFVDVIVDSSK